jgi:hypothetical protein
VCREGYSTLPALTGHGTLWEDSMVKKLRVHVANKQGSHLKDILSCERPTNQI